MRTTTPPIDRALRRVSYDHGCWKWTGATDANGYGYIQADGTRLAHRVVYRALVGPIPDGLVIDHLCRNPSCVNPDHMEVVTQGINVARGTSPIVGNEDKTHCPAGHPYSASNTYRTKRNGHRLCRECGAASARRTRRKARA